MAVYGGPDPVSNSICDKGFWEHTDPEDMGVSSGDQLLDIGANVGWYTFMFAQHGYNVLAVEPMTANRALIKATMCKNPELVAKITVVAAALTDKVDKPGQKCAIFSANINLGDGLLACGDEQIANLRDKAHNTANIQHIEREQVPLTTLDEVLASSKLTHIDVMKMDVERYECHVLAGASTLFTHFHPKGMMIETRASGKKKEELKPGQIGSTTDCTVKAVMKGGSYKIHSGNIAGPVIEEPTGAGVFNLYFSSEQK
jgi:FkbM family methyltransferase